MGEVFAVRGFIFAEGVLSSLLDSREAAKGNAGWCRVIECGHEHEYEHQYEKGANVWCCGVWGLRECCPLTPDPSPPAGARGGFWFSVVSCGEEDGAIFGRDNGRAV